MTSPLTAGVAGASSEAVRVIDDGFGNTWYKCQYEDCDLHVVRPGKARCTACDVEQLRSDRDRLRAELDAARKALERQMEDKAELVSLLCEVRGHAHGKDDLRDAIDSVLGRTALAPTEDV